MDRTRKLIATARNFLRCKRGNIAMMFSIMLIPLMIGAGAGLDFVRAMMVRQQMAEALDAAALAIGSTPGLNSTGAQALAQKYFDANYTVDKAQYGTVTVAPPNYDAKGKVTLSATNNMPTVLMKIAGITTVPVSANSTVVWGQTKLWVSLVLDNSGSMCEPLAQPCINTTDTTTKIYQLKDATKTMLTKLQAVSATPGDVQVAIVPFARTVDVGTANVSASWLYWGYWEAQPANAGLDNVTDAHGPGTACPFSTGTKGYTCQTSATNGSSTTSTIPSSGLICPSQDNGSVNPDRHAHYYNGCYDSTATQTKTDTKTDITPTTKKESCSQKGTNAESCSVTSNSTGSTTSNTTSATTAGYSGDSTTSSTNSSTAPPSDGTKSCNNKTPKTCTWTRTTVTTDVKTTITKTGVGPWKHSWVVNSHSTWGGCVTDRLQDYDISNAAPSSADTTGFPADNPPNKVSSTNCMYGDVTPLGHDWTDLSSKVDALQAKGSTNQGIGVAHGWQLLVPSGTYGTPGPLPANTTRYIILFSDGLNTQNRWWGDGSTEGTTEDGYIDTRMNLACSAAKADGVVIYTLYVHTAVGAPPESTPLRNCASDTSKYYNLTSSAQIATAFADITKKITNVRVSM